MRPARAVRIMAAVQEAVSDVGRLQAIDFRATASSTLTAKRGNLRIFAAAHASSCKTDFGGAASWATYPAAVKAQTLNCVAAKSAESGAATKSTVLDLKF